MLLPIVGYPFLWPPNICVCECHFLYSFVGTIVLSNTAVNMRMQMSL